MRRDVLAALNWTVVLASVATGLTAVVVAGIGYLGNRLTAATTARQVETDMAKFLAEQNEERRRLRQDLYRDILVVERRLAQKLTSRPPYDEVAGEFREVNLHMNSVILVAPKDVAREALGFTRAVMDVRGAVRTGYGPLSGAAAHLWVERRRRLIDAMRQDVAPDAAAIEEWEDVDDEAAGREVEELEEGEE